MVRKLLPFAFASVLLASGLAVWLTFLAKPPTFAESRWVRIYGGASLDAVADSLETADLLAQRLVFMLAAKATGWDDQIKAGCYKFDQGTSAYQVLRRLRAGEQTAVRVTIPSGSHAKYAARRAALHMLFGDEDFMAALTDSTLAEDLGTDTRHLFSYMLPDTYHFYCTTHAKDVVRRIKRAMDAFFADSLAALGTQHNLGRDEVISLAGIVEWETDFDEEKARVAGVYLNRLQRHWPLQADPTVQYALIELEGSKRRLFYADYRLQHPYNTYLHRGFPPGPITNPGRASLLAAASPEKHAYMFFVARPEGGHAFNVTLRGHNNDVARLRAYLRQRRRAAD